MLRLAAIALPFLLAACLRADLAPAVALFNEKRYPEAEAAFAAEAATNPRNATAHYYLGLLARLRQQFDDAVPHFEKAVALAPDVPEHQADFGGTCLTYAGRLGMSFRALGLARKGRTALEKAVSLAPDNVTYRQWLAEFYSRAPGMVGGGMDKAYAQVEEIKRRDSYAGTQMLAQLKSQEKHYSEAFALWDELLRERPDDYRTLYQIGRTAASSGQQLERGESSLRRCLDLVPPADGAQHTHVQKRLGDILGQRGDIPGARAAYQAALELDSGNKPAAEALAKLPND
ncbi:MAG TPA: tetratricopeptide repeat protein [Opitutaceae bacterium]